MSGENFDDEADPHKIPPRYDVAPYEEDFEDDENDGSSKRGRRLIFFIALVVALSVGAFFLGEHFGPNSKTPSANGVNKGTTINSVGVLTETELKNLVRSSHLTVYWAGPVEGDSYTLYVPKVGVAVVRYLPGGNGLKDTASIYRVIGTYAQKDATAAVQSAGKKDGSVGFKNIDGNSVFYVRTRPTNVYMAIKDQDIQVEIFDPGADQALALALFRGQIQQIK